MRQGSAHGIAILLQMIMLTGFIDDARRREIVVDVLHTAEGGLNAALERGKADRAWYLDAITEDLVAALMTVHERQLETTPLIIHSPALEQLERLRKMPVKCSSRENLN